MKTMRQIPTLRQVASRRMPRSHKQALAELTSLEHEKAQLQRKLKIWRHNQQQTRGRLERTQKRIAFLQQILDQRRSEDQSTASGRRPADSRRGEAKAWREVTLEY